MSKTDSSFTPRSNVIYIYRILFVCIIYRGFQMLLVVLLLLEAIFLLVKRIITAELFAAGLVAFANSQCFLSGLAKSASRWNSWLGAEAASLRAGTLCVVAWPSGECLCLLKWNVRWLTTWWLGDVWALLGCTWSSLNCLCTWGGCVILISFWSISLSIFGRPISLFEYIVHCTKEAHGMYGHRELQKNMVEVIPWYFCVGVFSGPLSLLNWALHSACYFLDLLFFSFYFF